MDILIRVVSNNIISKKSDITLFTTFFCSSSKVRQEELDTCLKSNIKNKHFDNVNVFVDYDIDLSLLKNIATDPSVEPFAKKLRYIFLDRIPSFKDWLSIPVNGISLFCNSDIYFDDSVSDIKDYVKSSKSVMCLTRKDVKGCNTSSHPNPIWSQDCWAINGINIAKIDFLEKLNISTGKMRCDNKFAYLFSMHGWDLYNPINKINCYHLHESNVRSYDKADTSILGALGFVYPCESPEFPSKVEIHVMPLKTANISVSTEVSGFLEHYKK